MTTPPSGRADDDAAFAPPERVGPTIDFEVLFDSYPTPLLLCDVATGRILAANDAAGAQYGYARSGLFLMTYSQLLAADMTSSAGDASAGPGSPPLPPTTPSIEYHVDRLGHIVRVDVTRHDVALTTGPAQLVVITEMSQHDKLEAKRRQALKMEAVGQLASGMAHDLNNLLAVISTSCELARVDAREAIPAGDRRQSLERHLDEIHDTVTRAAGLTRHVLAYARRQTLDATTLDVNAAVQSIERLLNKLLPANVRFERTYGADVGSAVIDPTQLERILTNLVINARDAMPNGGTLTLATQREIVTHETLARIASPRPGLVPGRYAALTVEDTGSGMTPVVLARMFEPFFTTKPLDQGSGLGLSTVYGIVKQSGGYVYADSRPEVGTRFVLLFPQL